MSDNIIHLDFSGHYDEEEELYEAETLELFSGDTQLQIQQMSQLPMVAAALTAAWLQSSMVQLHFAYGPKWGTRLPPDYDDKQGTEVLNFSTRFNTQPQLTREGITQLLSFGGIDHEVFVPWNAVFMVANRKTQEVVALIDPSAA